MNMATMKDVAAKAGVSVFTVSSVINDSAKIAPSTRERVLRAIAELNYIPNSIARSLRTQKSRTVGVLFPLFSSSTSRAFFGTVAEGIHDVLRENGYHLILSGITLSPAPDEEQRELDNLASKHIDGLIYAPVHCRQVSLKRENLPVVVVDRELLGFKGDRVFNNNFESSIEAVEYLISKGHRNIAYIGRRTEFSNHRERFLGYRKALEKNSLRFDLSLVKSAEKPDQVGIPLGYSACRDLLPLKVSAIFCNESYGTIGVLKYAKDYGLRIPGDLALITYDDLEWSEIVDPPLTVVRQPAYEMGNQAARILLNRIENPDVRARKLTLESKLIIRSST
jgi:LacI family transcriptional regulator